MKAHERIKKDQKRNAADRGSKKSERDEAIPAQTMEGYIHGTNSPSSCGISVTKGQTSVSGIARSDEGEDGRMKVYIAGPMSGIEDFNFPAFEAAAFEIREVWGYDVISPAEMDEEVGKDREWGFYLARDLTVVLTADIGAIVMLPGWEESKGAKLEKQAAEARGLRIIFYGEAEDRGPITRAIPLVHGDRQKAYGHPIEDFSRTAGMWKSMFGWDVKPRDVPLAMIAVKLSRLRKTWDHADSATDIAGYIETYEMCLEREDALP